MSDKSAIKKALKKLRAHPDLFLSEILGLPKKYIWSKMLEILHSVRDNVKTAVKAGHSVSKSFTAGRLALWFLYCFGPMCTVVTTAPTFKQVEDVLWREIRSAHASAPVQLPGEPTKVQLDLGEKWFATGFSTRPDTVTQQATAFQGYHNDYVLVIFDEACGIDPRIWEAADSLITNDRCRFLAIGNPTSPFGEFKKCFEDNSGWNCITISCYDTPNYQQGKEIIPGLAGHDFVESCRRKYGDGTNKFRSRVTGEFPAYVEGAIYGSLIDQAIKDGRVCDLDHDPSYLVHTAWDIGFGDDTVIWFFQLIGERIHVIDLYANNRVGISHYIDVLEDKRAEFGYKYGTHIGPHDLNNGNLTDGCPLSDTASRLGLSFTVLEREGRLTGGIELTRQVLQWCYFDKSRCELGIQALAEYHWKQNLRLSTDDKPVYTDIPEHDWTSHFADAFRYLARGQSHIGVADGRAAQSWKDLKRKYYG